MRKLLGIIFFLLIFLVYPSSTHAQVIVNEFSSGSSSDDWVEIYNNSAAAVDLSLYKLLDKTGNEKILTGSLASEGFIAFDWSNRLNNDGDVIYLVRISDLQTLDTLPYGSEGGVCSPSSSESAGRYNNGNVIERFSTSSKGLTNVGAAINPCPTPSPSPTIQSTSSPAQSPSPTPTPTKSPSPIPTKTATPKPTKTPSPSAEVLGEEVSPTPEVETPTSTPLVLDSTKKKVPIVPVVFIVSGLAMIGFAILQLVNAKKSTPET